MGSMCKREKHGQLEPLVWAPRGHIRVCTHGVEPIQIEIRLDSANQMGRVNNKTHVCYKKRETILPSIELIFTWRNTLTNGQK